MGAITESGSDQILADTPQRFCEPEDRYRQIIELSTEAHFIVLDDRIVYANEAGARLYRAADPDELIGLAPSDLVAPEHRRGARERVAAVQRGDNIAPRVEVRHVRLDGTTVDVEITSAPFVYRGRDAVQAVIRDITDRKRADQLLRLEHAIARSLADANSVPTALQAAIRAMCESENWECGEYWGWDQKAGVLRFGEFWSASGSAINGVFERSREIVFGPGVGLVGWVWQSREPLWVADVSKDPRVLRKDIVDETGLRGAFLFPVMSGANAIGVLTFNSREVRQPEDRLLQAVRVIGSQVGQFLRRSLAEEVVRDSEERFRSLTELSSDWYWEQDAELRFTRCEGRNIASRGGELARSLLGKHPWETGLEVEGGWEGHRAVLAARQPFHDLVSHRTLADGNRRYVSVSGEPVFDRDGRFTGYRGVGRDITARRRDEQLMKLEHTVTRLLADADSVSGGLKAVMRALCETENWECGRYFRVDEQAGGLRLTEGWSVPDAALEEFIERSHGLVYQRGTGLAGRVWESGEPLWVADLSNDPRALRAAFTLDVTIRGAFVFPVTAEGTTIGVFACNSREVRKPDERLLLAIGVIGSQIGQFLQRKQAEKVRRESEDRFRSLTKLSSDSYWEQDDQHRFVTVTGTRLDAETARAHRMLGKRRWELNYVNMTAASWAAHMAVLEARQPFRDLELCRLDEGGNKIWVSVSGEPVYDDSGVFKGYRGVGRDITESKQEERLLRLEHSVARCLAEADESAAGLKAVMQVVCESEDWACARYFRVDSEANVLRFEAGWSVPGAMTERFIAESRSTVFNPGVGLAGRVWQSGAPVWVPDVNKDDRVAASVLARETGIRGAFHFPVFTAGKTIGVLNFSSREVREPDARLLDAVRVIGGQVGQFLQRKQAERVLRESEERFRSLTNLSSDWYWEQDERFRFIQTTRNHARLGGHDPADSIGKTRWELPGVRALSAPWEEHRATMEARLPFRDFEYVRVAPDGHTRYTSVSGVPIVDLDGVFRGYRGVATDISERKLAEQRLTHLAQFDGLTGLPNRSLLRDRLAQTLAQASRKRWQVGVLFLDLDRFKLVNDTLGHQKGDQLLAQVATRLGTCGRPGDTVGRISGDEFAVILADLAHADDAALVAQRMIETIAMPFDLDGHEAFVGASIGISVYPGDSADPDVLLKNADVAMYRAKESGRNSYCFYTAEMNERSAAKLALNNDLRRALARGEFEVHYQPKVRLRDGGICGLEALLRWRHPERGLVLPGEFIPALEETGLIVPAGEWVIHAVCEQIKAWRASGLPALPVAINLSVRQFQQKDLDARIRGIIEAAGVEPAMIELEITESDLIRDPEHAIRVMRNLRDAGISISVDDFGTGYSSLMYLRELPISSLKIDRSFVRNVDTAGSDAAIVRAIIDLAHNLQFTVVAEGVETEAQAELLRSHGCELAQGYLFSRPVPATEIPARLAERPPRAAS